MITEARITDGIFFYDGVKLVGETYIIERSGVKQFHARNYGASAIRTVRRARRFLDGKGTVYSGCSEGNTGTIRILKILGFQMEGSKDGAVIFSKKEA